MDSAKPIAIRFTSTPRRANGVGSSTVPPEDVEFRVVVTEAKGLESFADNFTFTGHTCWRLSQIVRKLIRGLRIDPKHKYRVAIWNESKGSKRHLEWMKLSNVTQLENQPVPRLRVYRYLRPCNRRKPAVPEKPAKEDLCAQPTLDPELELQAMMMLNQMYMTQFMMMSCMFQGCLPGN